MAVPKNQLFNNNNKLIDSVPKMDKFYTFVGTFYWNEFNCVWFH
jgi:hypothetical protein